LSVGPTHEEARKVVRMFGMDLDREEHSDESEDWEYAAQPESLYHQMIKRAVDRLSEGTTETFTGTRRQTDIGPFNITIKSFTRAFDIVTKYSLNVEQAHVVYKVWFSLFDAKYAKQLIGYVGGEGGTGKSRVIQALCEMFLPHEVKKMAFTGSAAFNIGGRTIHSQLGKTKYSNTTKDLKKEKKLQKQWDGVRLVIIEEISFCPGKLLDELDDFLRHMQQNASNLSEGQHSMPFGGVSVITFGDFFQHLSIKANVFHSERWKCLNYVKTLTRQMRADGDENLKTILTQLRRRQPSIQTVNTLKQKILHDGILDLGGSNWDDITFITSLNALNMDINNFCMKYRSRSMDIPLHVIVAQDHEKVNSKGNVLRRITSLQDRKCLEDKSTCHGKKSNL
jgi:PIF1-like helicase